MRALGIGVLLVMLVLVGGQFAPAPDVRAQDGVDVCMQVASTAIGSAKEACPDLQPGDVCYGSDGASAVLAADQSGEFAAAGDVLALAALDSLTTSPADSETGEWGIAVMMLPATLPEGATGTVRAVAFGDTQIGRPVVTESDRPTITVTNSSNADVNLRNGAAISYTAVGKLLPGDSATADGRNEQGDWLRIQTDSGAAWVFVPVITWEGDIETLDVLAPDDVTPTAVSGEPFQSLTLTTGPASEACGSVPSGLLVQFEADEPATIQINGVSLASTDALLVVRSAEDLLEIDVIAGTVTATTRGISEEAEAGDALEVDLANQIPAAAPRVAGSYSFAQVVNTPVELMAGSLPCVVGLGDATAQVALRVGPGPNRGPLADMRADRSYTVISWANDPDGAPWWQLDTGTEKSWVAQTDVVTFGACDVVAQVDAPGLVTAAPAGAPATGGDSGASDGANMSSLAPTTNSVWQMYPGSDNMTGTCSGAPAINFCDHLAAIAPAQGGLSWKGMEASPYFLTEVQPNVYAYSGPNALGTGTVSMTLSFSSATSVSMTQVLTLSSEPDCKHTYYYTGTKNW